MSKANISLEQSRVRWSWLLQSYERFFDSPIPIITYWSHLVVLWTLWLTTKTWVESETRERKLNLGKKLSLVNAFFGQPQSPMENYELYLSFPKMTGKLKWGKISV